jgi:pimeloyl-ACP methyl ester carboxylesterase
MMHDGMVTSGTHKLVPKWPGELVDLPGGERVFVASTSAQALGRTHDHSRAAGHLLNSVHEVETQPVLCVHGMAGAATNWTELMAELAADFDCAAVDLPGYGWSPPAATMADYSIAALAATVSRLIEHQGRGPVHLIGNSMGGLIAVKLAASRPDLVRTLTLISPAMPDPLIRPALARFPLLGLPVVGSWLLRRSDAFPAQARVAGVMGMVFHDPGAVHPERLREAVAEMERRDQLGYANEPLIGAARAITSEYLRPERAAGNAWRLAAAVSCPVLAIYGSHDQLVNPKMAGRAARAFRDCRVIVLPYTGHVAQMEHPARVAAEFRELARAARAAARGMPAEPAGFQGITETSK